MGCAIVPSFLRADGLPARTARILLFSRLPSNVMAFVSESPSPLSDSQMRCSSQAWRLFLLLLFAFLFILPSGVLLLTAIPDSQGLSYTVDDLFG